MSHAALPLTPVICGPTAGGKSDLALDLARALRDRHDIPAEIVTADAFQVYSGLNIGTAKPAESERRGIPHHLIDIVPPPLPTAHSQLPPPPFTLDDWLTRANQTITDLRAQGTLPIVVGGTHLYIKALLEGLFEGPEPDAALRAQLAAMDPAERRKELERIDPAAAQRIHPNDARRTIRALEVFKLTGKPISAHQTQWDQPASSSPPPETRNPKPETRPPFLLIILDWQTEPLNARINARVKQMMERGLLNEVRSLIHTNGFTPQSAEALGYKQLIPIVRAALDAHVWPPPAIALDAAVEKIKVETRRFAKNQRTWLRRLSITPGAIRLSVPPSPDSPPGAAVHQILTGLELPS